MKTFINIEYVNMIPIKIQDLQRTQFILVKPIMLQMGNKMQALQSQKPFTCTSKMTKYCYLKYEDI